jgi:hypothetical protein
MTPLIPAAADRNLLKFRFTTDLKLPAAYILLQITLVPWIQSSSLPARCAVPRALCRYRVLR